MTFSPRAYGASTLAAVRRTGLTLAIGAFLALALHVLAAATGN